MSSKMTPTLTWEVRGGVPRSWAATLKVKDRAPWSKSSSAVLRISPVALSTLKGTEKGMYHWV